MIENSFSSLSLDLQHPRPKQYPVGIAPQKIFFAIPLTRPF